MQGNFMSWTGMCVKCGNIRQGGHGLLCSNFLLGWATFPPFRNVWCRECYREASNDRFPRLDNNREGLNATDLEIGVSLMLNRHQCRRNGDHLLGVPFECNLCLFRNVCGRTRCSGIAGPVHADLYLPGSVGGHVVDQGVPHHGHKLGKDQGGL